MIASRNCLATMSRGTSKSNWLLQCSWLAAKGAKGLKFQNGLVMQCKVANEILSSFSIEWEFFWSHGKQFKERQMNPTPPLFYLWYHTCTLRLKWLGNHIPVLTKRFVNTLFLQLCNKYCKPILNHLKNSGIINKIPWFKHKIHNTGYLRTKLLQKCKQFVQNVQNCTFITISTNCRVGCTTSVQLELYIQMFNKIFDEVLC